MMKRLPRTSSRSSVSGSPSYSPRNSGHFSAPFPIASPTLVKYSDDFDVAVFEENDNSLFHAIAYLLQKSGYKTPYSFDQLRLVAVNHIRDHMSAFIGHIEGDIVHYLEEMEKDEHGGGEQEIRALADALKIRIQVSLMNEEQLIYGKKFAHIIYLAFNGKNHYNPLIPKADASTDHPLTGSPSEIEGATPEAGTHFQNGLTIEGFSRLTNLKARVERLQSARAIEKWIGRLGEAIELDSVTWKQFAQVQILHLNVVWNYVSERIDNILYFDPPRASSSTEDIVVQDEDENPIVSFFKSIIRVVQIPNTFETFFLENEDVSSAFSSLHPYLQEKVRFEIVVDLDEVLIHACVDDFFDKSKLAEESFYNTVKEIISLVTSYADRRKLATNAHAIAIKAAPMHIHDIELIGELSGSFSEMMDISERGTPFEQSLQQYMAVHLKQTAVISRYAQNRGFDLGIKVDAMPVRPEDEVRGRRRRSYQILTDIPRPQLSKKMYRELWREKKPKAFPPSPWEKMILKLDDELLEEINQYEFKLGKELGKTYEKEGCQEPDVAWVKRKDSLRKIKELHVEGRLTPKAFFEIYQDNQKLLFNGWIWKDEGPALFDKIKKALKCALFIAASQNLETGVKYGYSIVREGLVKKLERKQSSFTDIRKGYNYLAAKKKAIDEGRELSEDEMFTWHAEKHAVVTLFLEKQNENELQPSHVPYVEKTFTCLAKRHLPSLRSSETENLVLEVKGYLEDVVWVDTGGDGPTPQHELRTQLYIS